MIKLATNWSPVLACLVGAYLSGLVALGRISSERASFALDVADQAALIWFFYKRDHPPRQPGPFLIEHRRAFKAGLYLLVALAFFVTLLLKVLVKQSFDPQRLSGFVFMVAFITLAVHYINRATRASTAGS